MYDVIFLSYDEPNANENFDRLKELVPMAKRVHGVRGILNAHKVAAQQSNTAYFWVVDGDNWVHEDFDFTQKWETLIPEGVSSEAPPAGFWKAKNSVNGLVYGYGGIKLLPRRATLETEDRGQVDITHSISPMRYYFDTVGSTTVINASAKQAWRAGFREAAKLTHAVAKTGDDIAALNLYCWLREGWDKPFGKDCIEGASAGREYVQVMLGATAHDGDDDPSGSTDYTPDEVNDYLLLEQWFNAGGPVI